MMQRRHFLKAAGSAAIASAGLLGRPAVYSAHAASVSGYKALVCVFLYGGLDNYDVLLPYDPASYAAFRGIRQTLMATQGARRQRESLLPIVPDDPALLGGREIALPPEMPQLKRLFDAGQAAVVANVGPLIEPVTRQQFEAGSVRLPPRLFSHNDQQATWQASAPEGAQFGWGGLFADAVLAAGGNASGIEFTTIASADVGPYLSGRVARPYQISPAGAARVDLLDDLREETGAGSALFAALRGQLRAGQFTSSHILQQDVADALGGSFLSNERYDQATLAAASVQTAFPAGPLGGQLRAVARTIAARSQLSVSRQVFFVGLGGFDTHSGQATALPALLSEIDGSLSAFHAAMNELGVGQDVTLFTASDFGRTLAVNGDGTDHGWGGHSFVLGGSVRGRQVYGAVPPAEFGHDADAGGGRVIPAVSVEQFAAPLGRWFGLDESALAVALPNLANFGGAGPAFLV